jgi:hypothetical protein
MNEQQDTKCSELVEPFKRSILGKESRNVLFDLVHVSESVDPGVFRRTVQAKIKEKYQENRIMKTSPNRIF